MHDPVLMTIQNCESMCEYMITFLCAKEDIELRRKQLQLLRDCTDICTLTAKYVARHSMFSRYCVNLCAYVCDMCGRECMKFKDDESQKCSEMCMQCAKECAAYAIMR